MSDHLHLAERLDAAVGDGPPPPPVGSYVRSGRRALLRRRIATVAGALAVIAVIGGAGLIGTATSDDGAGERVMQPAEQGADQADPAGVVREAASYDPAVQIVDGELHVAADVELVELTANPLGLAAPGASYGVAWTQDDVPHWEVHYDDDDVSGVFGAVLTDEMRRVTPTYAAFVADVVQRWNADATAIGESEPPTNQQLQRLELVELGPGETLEPVGATRLLERTSQVDLPDNFAPDAAPAAAALVVHDGFQVFVLARRLPGSPPEYIHYLADDQTGDDLASFLDFARAQYADEEGLR